MAMPVYPLPSEPPLDWPYRDGPPPEPRRLVRRPEIVAITVMSVVAVVAVVVALVLALTMSRTSGESASGPESVSALTPSPAPQLEQGPAESSEANRQRAEQAARLDRSTYATLSSRDFALMARDPDAWTGRKVIVYGVVTQFDTNTGPTAFRANTAATPVADRYDYDQNTYVQARDSEMVANVVEDDMVTMYVEIGGSYTYPTQIGGSTAVPLLYANIVDVTVSAKTVPAPAPRWPAPAPGPAPVPVDPQTQLRSIASSDYPFAAGQLADRWVPQLSSKRPGVVDKGIVWDDAATLEEHLQLRKAFGARLLWSGDWSTFDAPNFWVTVAGAAFPDADSALAWCRRNAFGPNDCYAKLVSDTHGVAGSTRHQ